MFLHLSLTDHHSDINFYISAVLVVLEPKEDRKKKKRLRKQRIAYIQRQGK